MNSENQKEWQIKDDCGPNIVLHKYEDGSFGTNVDHHWDRYAGAKNFKFGCHCLSTLNLALNILMHIGFSKQKAFALHRAFAYDFLVEPIHHWRVIPISRIHEWSDHQIKALKINVDEITVF